MNTPPTVQLHLAFAAECDVAVILRRARSKLWNLILWDRATDTFSEGQWLKKNVVPWTLSLSPDGAHLLYTVNNADPRTPATECYTVLSRPPCFTALALFPHGYSWQIGGAFLSDQLYMIGRGDQEPTDLIGKAEAVNRVYQGQVTKDCRSGLRLANGKPATLDKALRDRILGETQAPHATAQDRYDTLGGQLYRRRGMELELIQDFREMTPRFFPAPYDTRTADHAVEPWHPLDGQ